jgi:hypothetical protein
MATSSNNGPAHRIPISNLQATIWRNLGENGNWYTVKLTRGFKSDEGWCDTDNLGYDDLLAAAKLLDQAHTWIGHQLEADRKGRKHSENVTAQ